MQDEQVDQTNQVNVATKLSYCCLTQWAKLQNIIFTEKF